MALRNAHWQSVFEGLAGLKVEAHFFNAFLQLFEFFWKNGFDFMFLQILGKLRKGGKDVRGEVEGLGLFYPLSYWLHILRIEVGTFLALLGSVASSYLNLGDFRIEVPLNKDLIWVVLVEMQQSLLLHRL